MLELLFIPIAVFYLIVVGLLFAYGINFFYMTYLSLRGRSDDPHAAGTDEWPPVTVQLPIYNERYVVERLIRAAARLNYPADRLEIQVLDDSTDETGEIAARVIAELQARGHNIQHIQRKIRTGYKAGALRDGMARADGQLFAIFDADFIPTPEFLHRTVPYFKNPEIAFVQTRWGHVNREYSLLTYLQSLAIDAHFVVEQFARSRGNYWFNFNGTAGVWRRAAILEAGGWQDRTLTEDLDLSYRAFLSGWQAVYLRDVIVPAELPASFTAYRRQQHRWARGSLECARRFLPDIWRASMPVAKKLAATLHLTGYGVHLLLFALNLLYPLVLLLSQRYPDLISLFGIAALFNLTAFAPTAFFLAAQNQLGRTPWRAFPSVLFITVLGAGMMMNTLRAAYQMLAGRQTAFERTPKYGLEKRGESWSRRRYQLKLDPLIFIELVFAFYNLGTLIFALSVGNWVIAVYAAIFFSGLAFTSGLTLFQALEVMRSKQQGVL